MPLAEASDGAKIHYRALGAGPPLLLCNASFATCALLQKPSNTIAVTPVEYLGFTIPSQFVVGYGLDYEGRYRELPYIGVLPESMNGP